MEKTTGAERQPVYVSRQRQPRRQLFNVGRRRRLCCVSPGIGSSYVSRRYQPIGIGRLERQPVYASLNVSRQRQPRRQLCYGSRSVSPSA